MVSGCTWIMDCVAYSRHTVVVKAISVLRCGAVAIMPISQKIAGFEMNPEYSLCNVHNIGHYCVTAASLPGEFVQ